MQRKRSDEKASIARVMGKRVRAARKRSGIPALEFADRIGVQVAQLYRYESGENEIGLYRLARIAKLSDEGIESLVAGLDDLISLPEVSDPLDEAA